VINRRAKLLKMRANIFYCCDEQAVINRRAKLLKMRANIFSLL